MPSRLPDKGEVLFGHHPDGDHVGYVVKHGSNGSGLWEIHWLMRTPAREMIGHGSLLTKISEGTYKVCLPHKEPNIEAPIYNIGDLIESRVKGAKIIGLIVRSETRGHEVRFNGLKHQHCQFWYTVKFPHQEYRRTLPLGASGAASMDTLLNRKVEVLPEVLIAKGVENGTVTIHRAARKSNN